MAEVDLSTLGRQDRIAMLRARMEQLGATAPEPVVTEDVIPVPGRLGAVLQGGGLPKRSVIHVQDCSVLVVELLATLTQEGGYAAVVGWPDLLLAQVAESGGKLAHLISVPYPGIEPLNTAAVLCEGMDLVLYRSEDALELSPVRARPLLAKVRAGRAGLVLVNATVASPAVTIGAEVKRYHGIGKGSGRIRGVELDIRVQQKGLATARITLPVGVVPEREASISGGRPQLKVV
ncbi:hypothetical protein QVA66_05905 [Staphylococcus chromogenes]|nr:hypothetical protein [Staphylococcus chromogenes]